MSEKTTNVGYIFQKQVVDRERHQKWNQKADNVKHGNMHQIFFDRDKLKINNFTNYLKPIKINMLFIFYIYKIGQCLIIELYQIIAIFKNRSAFVANNDD